MSVRTDELEQALTELSKPVLEDLNKLFIKYPECEQRLGCLIDVVCGAFRLAVRERES